MYDQLVEDPGHELRVVFGQLDLEDAAALLVLGLSEGLGDEVVLVRLGELLRLWQLVLMVTVVIVTSVVVTVVTVVITAFIVVVVVISVAVVVMLLWGDPAVRLFVLIV